MFLMWLHIFFQGKSENQTRYKIYRNLPSFSDFLTPDFMTLIYNVASYMVSSDISEKNYAVVSKSRL
jgi:hypothetical protein